MIHRFISRGIPAFLFCFASVLSVGAVNAADEKTDEKAAKPEAAGDEAAKDGEVETKDVKHQDLELKLPKTWKVAPSSSNMRLATYAIPAVEGDEEAGEFAIFTFPNGGGALNENLTRWIEQFSSDGRTSVLKQGKVGENHYYVADITGTYQKPKGPPVLRQTTPAPGYRMIALVVELEGKGVYYLKATGPEATIKANAEVLRKAIGGKSEGETDYEI